MRHRTVPFLAWLLAVGALVLGAAPLLSQESGPVRPRAEELRRRIRERFADRIRQELQLNDEQMQQLRTTVGRYAGRRRDLERHQAAVRSALSAELRPGVAASADSVSRLTDELMTLRVRYAESFREEQSELSKYLDPVQRARLTMLRDRLVNRAREFRGRRPVERRMDR
jgi:hypothetical protein